MSRPKDVDNAGIGHGGDPAPWHHQHRDRSRRDHAATRGLDHDKIAAFYDKHGAPPGTFAAAVLDALARPCLVVVSRRSQVLAPYLSQRLSPWLTQSLARVITKEGQPLWATRV